MNRIIGSMKYAVFAIAAFLLCLPFFAQAQSDTFEVFSIKFAGTDKQFYEAEWASGGGKDVPVGFSPVLEDATLPQTADIISALRDLAAY